MHARPQQVWQARYATTLLLREEMWRILFLACADTTGPPRARRCGGGQAEAIIRYQIRADTHLRSPRQGGEGHSERSKSARSVFRADSERAAAQSLANGSGVHT